MQAVYLEKGKVSVVRRPVPRRPKGWALIRLVCGGICNTDLELCRGYFGFRGIPGHEFVGEVVNADRSEWIGKRVVGEINLGCGRCSWCRGGLGRHCPRRTVLGIVRRSGAFQEFFVLPEANLHEVPAGIPTEQAVFAEPLAAACEILEQVTIPRGEEVAVLGDGKLGLLIAQVLKLHGARVHLYGRHRSKMKIARAAGIETRVVVGARTQARHPWVVDATGSSDGLKAAIAMTRPRGTVILKSTVHAKTAVDTAAIVVNEIALVGSRCGRFEPALRLLREGTVRLEEMIAASLPIAQARRAFQLAEGKGILKVLLTPG